MAFEAEGKLIKIFPTEQKTASFAAREFVIEMPDGKYPQLIKFQAVQDNCNVLDNFREGDKIKVSFDLRGREWQGKYFTSLTAWRIDKAVDNGISAVDNSFPEDPFPSMEPPRAPANNNNGGGFDDLPF
jgi:single-strand DNA-binding protein